MFLKEMNPRIASAIIGISTAICCANAGQGKGIAFYVTSPHYSDSVAKAVIYTSIGLEKDQFKVSTIKGHSLMLSKFMLREAIEVPQLDGDYVHDEQFAQLIGVLGALNASLKRFPKGKEIVQPLASRISEMVERNQNGQVYFRQKWINKNDWNPGENPTNQTGYPGNSLSSNSEKEMLMLTTTVANARPVNLKSESDGTSFLVKPQFQAPSNADTETSPHRDAHTKKTDILPLNLAVEKRLVSAEITGEDAYSVYILIALQTTTPLSVHAKPGMMLIPTTSGYQPMVIAEEKQFDLSETNPIVASHISTVSASLLGEMPTPKTNFHIKGGCSNPNIARLTRTPGFASLDPQHRQLTIWVLSDDIGLRGHRNVNGNRGIQTGPTRSQLGKIHEILQKARLDPKQFTLFKN